MYFKQSKEVLEAKLGKGYRTGRYIALTLSSIFFTPYKSLKN